MGISFGAITHVTIVASFVLMRIASIPTANLSYLAIAIYALMGRAHAIQALGLSWLFTMLNPGIGPAEVPFSGVGRYIVVAAAAISVLVRSSNIRNSNSRSMNTIVFATLIFCSAIILHSLVISPIVDVSILKAVVWTVAFVTLYSAWIGLEGQARTRLETQLFGCLVIMMVISVPLLGTSIGYLRNESGFQGVLNHPQAFGATLALLAAWLGARLLADSRASIARMTLFALSLILILLSQARTAGLGLFLGLGVAVVMGRWLARRRWIDFLPGLRRQSTRAALAISVAMAAVLSPFWAPYIGEYVAKGAGATSIASAYEGSRGFLIERMWGNIERDPLSGIGFGISSDVQAMVVMRDKVFGLPIGTVSEKGVAFLAIWEELGLFGLFGAILWLWLLLRRAAIGGGVAALAVYLTALCLNFGESMLFSPGGMGMLLLILITWASSNMNARQGAETHG